MARRFRDRVEHQVPHAAALRALRTIAEQLRPVPPAAASALTVRTSSPTVVRATTTSRTRREPTLHIFQIHIHLFLAGAFLCASRLIVTMRLQIYL
jgi:hypothetical protein